MKPFPIIIIAVVLVAGGIWYFASQNNEPTANTTPSANTSLTNAPSDTNVSGNDATSNNTPDLGPVPSFSLKNYVGVTVSSADYTGKALVINTWASWCPFCINEMPDFASVQRELGDKITIIAINRAESLNTAKDYTDDLGVGNDLVLLLDPGDSFYNAIGGFSMPETILVDPNGRIREHIRGPITAAMLKTKLAQSLGIE